MKNGITASLRRLIFRQQDRATPGFASLTHGQTHSKHTGVEGRPGNAKALEPSSETVEERRTHIRYPVDLGVDVSVPGKPTRRATLRDLGGGGALLSNGDTNGLHPGSLVRIGLCLSQERNEIRYRVPARVVHNATSGGGLHFLEAPPGFRGALHNYLRQHAQEQVE